jgi:hypothetical protein
MLDPEHNTLCREFFADLMHEIVTISDEVNAQNDGSMQDGFSTRTLDDGWITYKGMSCGFALQAPNIYMTLGPDAPFVGYTMQFKASMNDDGDVVWADEKDHLFFRTANQLARYALASLASKVHDQLPELDFGVSANTSTPTFIGNYI